MLTPPSEHADIPSHRLRRPDGRITVAEWDPIGCAWMMASGTLFASVAAERGWQYDRPLIPLWVERRIAAARQSR